MVGQINDSATLWGDLIEQEAGQLMTWNAVRPPRLMPS